MVGQNPTSNKPDTCSTHCSMDSFPESVDFLKVLYVTSIERSNISPQTFALASLDERVGQQSSGTCLTIVRNGSFLRLSCSGEHFVIITTLWGYFSTSVSTLTYCMIEFIRIQYRRIKFTKELPLHIQWQTQTILKVESLMRSTMVQGCWQSSVAIVVPSWGNAPMRNAIRSN